MYKGTLLADTGRIPGTVTIAGETILFTAENRSESFPIAACDIDSGGTSDRLVYFTHRESQLTLAVPDRAILKEPLFTSHRDAISAAQTLQQDRSVKLIHLLFVLVLFAFGAYGLYKMYPIGVKMAVAAIPQSVEQTLGEKLEPMILKDATIVEDSSVTAMLDSITTALISANGLDSSRFKFYVVVDKQVNAFALPSGTVIINSGLIIESESIEELAGVIAHEIAHITSRHHIRGIVERLGVLMVVRALMGSFDVLPAQIMKAAKDLTVLGNSRAFEYEADRVGAEYMMRANLDATGMLTFFERLSKKAEGNLLQPMEFLSTHPTSAKRMLKLAEITQRTDFSCKKIIIDYNQTQLLLQEMQ